MKGWLGLNVLWGQRLCPKSQLKVALLPSAVPDSLSRCPDTWYQGDWHMRTERNSATFNDEALPRSVCMGSQRNRNESSNIARYLKTTLGGSASEKDLGQSRGQQEADFLNHSFFWSRLLLYLFHVLRLFYWLHVTPSKILL